MLKIPRRRQTGCISSTLLATGCLNPSSSHQYLNTSLSPTSSKRLEFRQLIRTKLGICTDLLPFINKKMDRGWVAWFKYCGSRGWATGELERLKFRFQAKDHARKPSQPSGSTKQSELQATSTKQHSAFFDTTILRPVILQPAWRTKYLFRHDSLFSSSTSPRSACLQLSRPRRVFSILLFSHLFLILRHCCSRFAPSSWLRRGSAVGLTGSQPLG